MTSVTSAANARRETGASLIIVMLMLIVVLALGISAAHIALQGEKVSRNDRDRQIAFQAAEAGLMDAERDIQHSPDAGRSRSALFAPDSALGFVDGCGNAGTSLGLCSANEGAAPAWQTVEFTDQSADAHTVSYGTFTGQVFQTGSDSISGHTSAGSLPARLPRYIIELMKDSRAGQEPGEEGAAIYRVTAIGFGMRESTQVVLQTIYKKDGQ